MMIKTNVLLENQTKMIEFLCIYTLHFFYILYVDPTILLQQL